MIEEKELILSEIIRELKESQGFIVTSFKSINANQFADFRKAMFDAKCHCVMMKKRILKKAVEGSGLETTDSKAAGHALFIYTKESFIEATKAFVTYRKKNPEHFDLKGGYFEQKFCQASDVEMIASLPTLDEARAQMLSLIEAPMSGLMALLESAMLSPVFCIDQKAQQPDSTN